MEEMRRLTIEDGILYALYLADGEVLGITRLNKIIDKMQIEGLPITNEFTNDQNGPYDPLIRECANVLDTKGLISQQKTPRMQVAHSRDDFSLTECGRHEVEERILPFIKNHQFLEILMASLGPTIRDYKSMQIDTLIKKVHDDLYISPGNIEFLTKFSEVRTALIAEFNQIAANHSEFCYAELVVLGSLDFALRCLNKIEGNLDNEASGKNHILAKSNELLSYTKLFKRNLDELNKTCLHSGKCAFGIHCLPIELDNIGHGLQCLEWNSKVYGIVEPCEDIVFMPDVEESSFQSNHLIMNTTV